METDRGRQSGKQLLACREPGRWLGKQAALFSGALSIWQPLGLSRSTGR